MYPFLLTINNYQKGMIQATNSKLIGKVLNKNSNYNTFSQSSLTFIRKLATEATSFSFYHNTRTKFEYEILKMKFFNKNRYLESTSTYMYVSYLLTQLRTLHLLSSLSSRDINISVRHNFSGIHQVVRFYKFHFLSHISLYFGQYMQCTNFCFLFCLHYQASQSFAKPF